MAKDLAMSQYTYLLTSLRHMHACAALIRAGMCLPVDSGHNYGGKDHSSVFEVVWPACSTPTTFYGQTMGSCPFSLSAGSSCSLGCQAGYTQIGSGSVSCVKQYYSPLYSSDPACRRNCDKLAVLPSRATAGTCTGVLPWQQTCNIACNTTAVDTPVPAAADHLTPPASPRCNRCCSMNKMLLVHPVSSR
jgi:hypothetical protein